MTCDSNYYDNTQRLHIHKAILHANCVHQGSTLQHLWRKLASCAHKATWHQTTANRFVTLVNRGVTQLVWATRIAHSATLVITIRKQKQTHVRSAQRAVQPTQVVQLCATPVGMESTLTPKLLLNARIVQRVKSRRKRLARRAHHAPLAGRPIMWWDPQQSFAQSVRCIGTAIDLGAENATSARLRSTPMVQGRPRLRSA